MQLFELSDLHNRPKKRSETKYQFYCRTSDPTFVCHRDTFEEWFSRIRNVDYKKKLSSMISESFDSVFHELLIHEFGLNLGFDVTPEYQLAQTYKTPDFLFRKREMRIIVEGKVVLEREGKSEGIQKNLSVLLDQIDAMQSGNFFLNIGHIKLKTNKSIASKSVIRWIKDKIEKLNWEEEVYKQSTSDCLPELFEYDDNELSMEIRFIPRHKEYHDPDRRAIGIHGGITRWGDKTKSVKRELKKKFDKYRNPHTPIIVWLNCLDYFTINDRTMLDILEGTGFTDLDQNGHVAKSGRHKDGLLGGNSGHINRHVSAVILSEFVPSNLHVTQGLVYVNDKTSFNIDITSELSTYIKPTDHSRIFTLNIGNSLNIKGDWLN